MVLKINHMFHVHTNASLAKMQTKKTLAKGNNNF